MKTAGCLHDSREKLARGGFTYLWRWDDVREWMALHARSTPVKDAARESASVAIDAGTEANELDSKSITGSLSQHQQSKWKNALERARYMERIEFNEYVKFVSERNLISAAHASKRWQDCLDSLRKMELDASKIEKQRGEVMPIAEHEKIFVEAHSMAANELRGLSKKVAPLLIGMKDVHEIASKIDKEVRACMRHIEIKLNEMEASDGE
jgi:hypothetical protein